MTERPHGSDGDGARPMRRFYTAATIGPVGTVQTGRPHEAPVLLDGRQVRTPGRSPLVAPPSVAQRVAMEWNAQGDTIVPATMPLTRLVNTAIDGVSGAQTPVKQDIAAIAANDLVIYRADWPDGLVARQRAAWDPVVEDAECRFGVRLVLTEGVMPVAQEAALAPAVTAALPDAPLPLAALHQVTTLTGSAFLAIAVHAGALPFDAAWSAAHVDEDWNIARWGEDGEAAARRAARYRDAEAAAMVLHDAGTRSDG